MVRELPPLKIVYATTWFGTTKFPQDEDIGRSCPIPEGYFFNLTEQTSWCTITSDEQQTSEAAGLIMHAPDVILGNLLQHVKNQPWILESLESPFSSPFRADEPSMKDFDYLASYNFKSSFLFSYFSPSIMDAVNRPLPKDFIKTKRKGAPILWIARNCRATNGREAYIAKLKEYVRVDSYGTCLNNKEFPVDKSRMDLLGEYKFYLAAENSNCDDYVTEKLADTLAMSAVPIVDGPPSYQGYVPSERSIIHMDAYPDPKDLADYINYLDGNDTAYLEYLSFRRDAISIPAKDRLESSFINNWSDTIAHNKISSYCSICRGLTPWWKAKQDGKTYTDPKTNIFRVDDSCTGAGKWNYVNNGPPYKPNWTPRPRDEFTRPNINPVVDQPISEITQDSVVSDKRDKRDAVIIANASFIFLFVVFIVVLLRQSKKSQFKNNINDPLL